jgi:hypothetical protein
MMFNANSPEVVSWVAACQKLINEHYEQNLTNLKAPKLEIMDGSRLMKIVRKEEGDKFGSVFAFLAKCDNHTKVLGNVKAGDILKAASFNTPAKNARGNLLDSHGGMGRMTAWGTEYNR